jgi:hypothetical protein
VRFVGEWLLQGIISCFRVLITAIYFELVGISEYAGLCAEVVVFRNRDGGSSPGHTMIKKSL